MVAMEQTIIDDFDDDSLTGWTTFGTPGNIAETGGELRISSASGAAFSFHGVDYGDTVDYDGVYYGALLIDPGDIDGIDSYSVNTARGTAEDINFSWIIRRTGVASPVLNFASVGSNLDYDSEVHRYFAVGIHEGNLEWVWSTDGLEWTVHHAQANELGTTVFRPSMMVGTDDAEDDITAARWDDFSAWVRGQTVEVGSATQTGTAQTFTATKVHTLGSAPHASTAQTLDTAKARSVASATYADAAQLLGTAKAKPLATASDTATAPVITRAKRSAIATATASETAYALGCVKTLSITAAVSSHAAASFGRRKTRGLSAAASGVVASGLLDVASMRWPASASPVTLVRIGTVRLVDRSGVRHR